MALWASSNNLEYDKSHKIIQNFIDAWFLAGPQESWGKICKAQASRHFKQGLNLFLIFSKENALPPWQHIMIHSWFSTPLYHLTTQMWWRGRENLVGRNGRHLPAAVTFTLPWPCLPSLCQPWAFVTCWAAWLLGPFSIRRSQRTQKVEIT